MLIQISLIDKDLFVDMLKEVKKKLCNNNTRYRDALNLYAGPQFHEDRYNRDCERYNVEFRSKPDPPDTDTAKTSVINENIVYIYR